MPSLTGASAAIESKGTFRGTANPAAAKELRDIAHLVRSIGNGRNANPESIVADKHDAADRLFAMARKLERGT